MEDVIVFGRGAYWKKKSKYFLEKHNVVAYLDNSPDSSKESDNVPVVHPSCSKNMPALPIYIMTSIKYLPEMFKQLIGLGIPCHRIFFGFNEPPVNSEIEELFHRYGVTVAAHDDCLMLHTLEENYMFETYETYQKIISNIRKKHDFYARCFTEAPLKPSSRHFGIEYGRAIDRYYIEKFLFDNRSLIHGDVLEVADSTYTYKFGTDISHAYKMHVEGENGCLRANLVTGEGLKDEMVDCFICTQTLQFIFEIQEAIKTIYRILKPGGSALITVPGISQIVMGDYKRWGDYWRFTDKSISELLVQVFPKDKLKIKTWGNMKVSIGFLYGLSCNDLSIEDFNYRDEQYQFLITAVCQR